MDYRDVLFALAVFIPIAVAIPDERNISGVTDAHLPVTQEELMRAPPVSEMDEAEVRRIIERQRAEATRRAV